MQETQTPQINYREIPDPFPPAWAIAYGQDNKGFWAELQIKNVIQGMRWIPSGRFLMGSPEQEHERLSNEKQFKVTLTQGYWLADTACTQEFWQAVMDDNPALFNKDKQNPVENVSWDDVQTFLKKLNTLIPQLKACLPTEAQWEYACRAGTATPFSFGDNITPEQVNFDGNYPYAGGKKGQYREETIAVKALAGNQWGLYQMHGNVREWCQDWYGDYPAEAMIDPTGAEQGEYCVSRGGSWIRYGQLVRSASRYRSTPDDRFNFIGFRLSLGQATGEAVAES